MAYRLRAVRDLGEYGDAMSVIGHYFGWAPSESDARRFARVLPLERMHAVWDDGRIVAGTGVYPIGLTVPGGALPCAGVTLVGVLPSHRRRGLLRRMMEAQLRESRERGEPIAALWASEETIYGRFGYGLASTMSSISAELRTVGIAPGPHQEASVRLVSHEEALRVFPRIYERVARERPGMVVRTRDWWEVRRLDDHPERRGGAGPLVRVLLERGDRPVGYALYRLAQDGAPPDAWTRTIRVSEAVGIDDGATHDVWRFLLGVDWVDRITAHRLPRDHPLPLLVDRFDRLRLSVRSALWLRLLDVRAALAGRSYATAGRVTVEVAADPLFPDNVGAWTIEDGAVRRARRRVDVRLAVDALASVYLGELTFHRLARAGRAAEVARGGVERADAAFRVALAPWAAENF